MKPRVFVHRSLLALALLLGLGASPAGAGEAQRLTVVELYTSQGCSSCPPADKYLGELTQRPDLLALTFHVDYWDYIGWKDPFASPQYTARQRDYARKLGIRYVYTPQMVIQGTHHITGSDRSGVRWRIEKAASAETVPVTLDWSPDGQIAVSLPEAQPGGEAVIWLVMFDAKHTTDIRRGENRGKTLSYYNVVRSLTELGRWSGRAGTFRAADGPSADGRDGCAVIVQSVASGRIIGAARLALPGRS